MAGLPKTVSNFTVFRLIKATILCFLTNTKSNLQFADKKMEVLAIGYRSTYLCSLPVDCAHTHVSFKPPENLLPCKAKILVHVLPLWSFSQTEVS